MNFLSLTSNESADEQYKLLRQKLHSFFERRGCLSPEDLANETLDRVSRKLSKGEGVSAQNLARYCYGVASHILREHWRSSVQDAIYILPIAHNVPIFESQQQTEIETSANQETDISLHYLQTCLEQLPPEDRLLILKYYEYGSDDQPITEKRLRLAQNLGIGISALRVRAHRIRERLSDQLAHLMEAHGSNQDISSSQQDEDLTTISPSLQNEPISMSANHYSHLVDKKFSVGLSNQELNDLERLREQVEIENAVFYEPIIERLTAIEERLKAKAHRYMEKK